MVCDLSIFISYLFTTEKVNSLQNELFSFETFVSLKINLQTKLTKRKRYEKE